MPKKNDLIPFPPQVLSVVKLRIQVKYNIVKLVGKL